MRTSDLNDQCTKYYDLSKADNEPAICTNYQMITAVFYDHLSACQHI